MTFLRPFSVFRPEIWSQTGGALDAFVMAAGTGGTIAGIARHLHEHDPGIEVFLIDPPGSALYSKIESGVLYTPEQSERRLRRNRYDTIMEGIGMLDLTGRACVRFSTTLSTFRNVCLLLLFWAGLTRYRYGDFFSWHPCLPHGGTCNIIKRRARLRPQGSTGSPPTLRWGSRTSPQPSRAPTSRSVNVFPEGGGGKGFFPFFPGGFFPAPDTSRGFEGGLVCVFG